jgi:primosomal replication protein N
MMTPRLMMPRPNRKVANRIELCGRLATTPSLRVTPAGTPVLSLVVVCGDKAEELRISVVIAGESARELAPRLRQGLAVRARGSLRSTHARKGAGLASLGVEVIADEIALADASNLNEFERLP